MSSQEATHANHSAPLGSAEDQTTRDICGPRCLEPLAFYDPELRSWRMFGVITLWGLTVSLETLPTSGMTVSGKLFRRSPWERHTAESGSSAWPTPVSSSSMAEDVDMVLERLESGRPYKSRLVEAVAMWPTPTAHCDNSNVNGKFQNPTLGDAVRMWPTPTTQEVEHPDLTLTETGRRMSLDGTTSHSLNLADAVSMWPTPTHGKLAGGSGANQRIEDIYQDGQITLEEKKSMQAGNGGRLNPMWVEWLMGFPLGWTDCEDSATP